MSDLGALLSVPSDLGGSTLFPSVQAERGGDARVGDARRFAVYVGNMVIRARAGGPPPRLDRIAGPDRTGTAFAVVDAVGRFVDVSLRPDWWSALGPARVASGLIEALATARLKAALVPMILRRHDYQPLPGESTDDGFLDAARGKIDTARGKIDAPRGRVDAPRGRVVEAYRLINDVDRRPTVRAVAGPLGLFRVYARDGRIERAEVTAVLTPGDTDRLLADARHALAEPAKTRGRL
ncbi:hypothetical protein ODJ79_43520 [Actinoplanes sp. KI2]|uniref:hypothetical protein n=1 Tax=Actinoplanes sp. KI2 TaxID=2983315 RepID=UPI0021D57EC0|nr:hypothetical protein [Actinoplanes sp. KI2]MCU7730628.1 hypothetical protein [Actinoplanes sp. KI2]